MPITINYKKFADRVDDNTLILTPNSRTQKAIIAGFVEQLSVGQSIYAPNVLSLSQWQEKLWEELSFIQPLPRIIGDLEIKVWLKEQISCDKDWQLTNELGVAEKVLEAYKMLSQWGMVLQDIKNLDTIENQYFIKWVKLLEDFLHTAHLIPQFSRLSWLNKANDILIEFLPDKILLVGFNQMTPVENDWLTFCEQQGCEVLHHYPSRHVIHKKRFELADLKQEIEFSAELSIKLAKDKPENTVGVVVHQLAHHLELVHQVFSEKFQPDELMPWQPLEKVKYNVSAGHTLIEMPAVSVAVKLIMLNSSGIDLQTLLLLKNTPFIDWGEHSSSIKYFLHQQSLLTYDYYSLEYLENAIQINTDQNSLSLLTTRISYLKNKMIHSRPMSAWVNGWKETLNVWGWLKNYDLDENECKQLTEFQTTLNETTKLSLIYQKNTISQAREFLQQTLLQKTFQLPSDRTNVHVLGVLEATGLEFEHLILVGFERENWPQKALFNPFLPRVFQQKYDMPGSSAEREYQYAKGISNSLINCTDHLWVTQSMSAEEIESKISPFFSHIELSLINENITIKKTQKIQPNYHWRTDDTINFNCDDVAGGAYFLSHFASCPFKAMSHFQFNLHLPQAAQKGIDAKIRGAWLHRTLELLWIELKDQTTLINLSPTELNDLINRVLTEAKKEFESQLFARTSKKIIELEYQKNFQLINEWLTIEKSRNEFSVQTEVDKTLTLGALTFRFRIDRIDTNSSGNLEIIDYKTGNTSFKKWLGKRPDEAQMPAYALSYEENTVDSLSYAKIKTGEVERNGVWFESASKLNSKFHFAEINVNGKKDKTKNILSLPSLINPQRSMIEQWKIDLEALANKIAVGEMPVSPKNKLDACRYCHFSNFCRINEEQPKTTLKIEIK